MKRQLNILISSAFFLVIMISYQNCGVTQQGSLFDKATYSIMPYEMKVNQLAYLSCSEQGNVANDAGVFFTFRSGAYGSSAGVRITEDFLYKTRKMSQTQIMDLLYEDPGTSLSRLQLATRRSGSLSSMFINADSGGGSEEIDFDYVMGDFGSDEMSASLLTAPDMSYLNYWSPAGVNKDAYFEGTLVYNSSESLSNQLRQFFAQDGILAWAYADAAKPANVRSPSLYDDPDSDEDTDNSATNKALGVGMRIGFKQPLAANWYAGTAGPTDTTVPKRVLSSVSTYDLATLKSTGNWQCPNTLQFRVIYPDDIWELNVLSNPNDDAPHDPSNDANFETNPIKDNVLHADDLPKLCPQRLDNHADNTGAYAARLAIVRRSLPASDWFVNIRYQCIIPKKSVKGSCYGIDAGTNETRSVAYNPMGACNPAISSSGLLVCGHYMSICYQ